MRFPYPVDHEIPVILAPMAGVSESPFRRLCRKHGADVVVTEFLSAEPHSVPLLELYGELLAEKGDAAAAAQR